MVVEVNTEAKANTEVKANMEARVNMVDNNTVDNKVTETPCLEAKLTKYSINTTEIKQEVLNKHNSKHSLDNYASY